MHMFSKEKIHTHTHYIYIYSVCVFLLEPRYAKILTLQSIYVDEVLNFHIFLTIHSGNLEELIVQS